MGIPNFDSPADYDDFLTDTLIPDLRESGSDALADDFEEFLYWIARV